ncbi:hypothetical protein BDV06DRAFT_229298 [Aspergillus oleicola]
MTNYTPTDKQTLPPLGFLAVECFFYRPSGDAFNENTWAFPITRELAYGSQENVLVSKDDYDEAFIDAFVQAGKRLAERGAVGIITSCGFLAQAQPALASRLPIPIATSSLLQIPAILCFLPPTQSIGIITYNATKLGPLHFSRLGIPPSSVERCHIAGAPSSGSLQGLVRGQIEYNHDNIEKEMIEAARGLVEKHPEIGAIVLECTQMPVYAEAIQRETNVPVYDVFTMASWFYSGLVRRRPVQWGDLGGQRTGPLVERNVMCDRCRRRKALVLIAQVEIGYGRNSKGWLLSGMAFRLAHEIGPHLDPKNWDDTSSSASYTGLGEEAYGPKISCCVMFMLFLTSRKIVGSMDHSVIDGDLEGVPPVTQTAPSAFACSMILRILACRELLN